MKIFLIGFMGSGKSTIGPKIAKALDYEFIDLDHVIEQTAGISIAQYFEKYGEPAFRDLEKEVLHGTELKENAVIATGGGTPCFLGNMAWMNSSGITVYISLSPKLLADRLESGKAKRPLIKGFDQGELIVFITERLAAREEFYKQAEFVLSGVDLTAQKLIDSLKLS